MRAGLLRVAGFWGHCRGTGLASRATIHLGIWYVVHLTQLPSSSTQNLTTTIPHTSTCSLAHYPHPSPPLSHNLPLVLKSWNKENKMKTEHVFKFFQKFTNSSLTTPHVVYLSEAPFPFNVLRCLLLFCWQFGEGSPRWGGIQEREGGKEVIERKMLSFHPGWSVEFEPSSSSDLSEKRRRRKSRMEGVGISGHRNGDEQDRKSTRLNSSHL